MTKPAVQGHLEAHTRAEAEPIEADQAGAAWSSPLPGADPGDLLAGSPDIAAVDLLSVAAELVAAPRRARGRPAGATNRKNGDMIAYLQQLGHRDPWVTLSLIQTADTMKLAEMLGEPLLVDGRAVRKEDGSLLMIPVSPLAVLAMQQRAADALMPYHHAKKPQQLELPAGDQRPLMIIGEMNVAIASVDGFMSAGVMPGEKANEINGEVVRQSEAMPHDDVK